MTSADGKVGIQSYADNSVNPLRTERTGALCTVLGHSANVDFANRGKIMVASNAAAGVAPGTALSTTPPIAIWNPPGSGVNLNIMKVCMGYISGTLGAGSIVYAYALAQVAAPTTGTELTPNCTLLGSPRGVGRAFTGSTIITTPTLLRPAFTIGAFAGGANPPAHNIDEADGTISIPPGSIFVVQGIAGAGTSPLVLFSVTWEEVPQ